MRVSDIDGHIESLQTFGKKVDEQKTLDDISVLYDMLLEYLQICTNIDMWSNLVSSDKSSIDFECFSKNWNIRLTSTCADLNSILETIHDSFCNNTLVTKDMTSTTIDRGSVHYTTYETNASIQLFLLSKIIDHQRKKFIFVLCNSLTYHDFYLKNFKESLGKENHSTFMN